MEHFTEQEREALYSMAVSKADGAYWMSQKCEREKIGMYKDEGDFWVEIARKIKYQEGQEKQ